MSVTAPLGFRAAGVASGIEPDRPDLALVVADGPCTSAGVFTSNLAQAAPVLVSREHLRASRTRATVATAGCANAALGAAGLTDAREMAALTARAAGCPVEEVVVASTGVIGVRLPMEKVRAGIATAFPRLSREGGPDAARAIMTTDTKPKQAVVPFTIGGVTALVGGMATGAGMPDPMLVFRETASNTNERTCIAAVLPERSAASHTLSGIQLKNVRAEAAGTVLNSFCFDFALRLRTAGTHVSFTYIKAVPVPPAHVANHFPILPSAEGWRFGLTHITEDANLWPDLWRANRAVAEAYGLDANDFEHILTAFPVFARKRPEFFAYLKERLHEWKAEAHPRAKVIQLYLPSEEEPAELPLAAETPAELPSEDDEYKS